MLSEEEKKAYDNLIMLKYFTMEKEDKQAIDIILNLIEKQSKEIEELKNGQIDFWISDKEIEERIRNKFVSKDKIKAKIEEIIERLEAKPYTAYTLYGDVLYESDEIVQMLQSLLEKE